MRVRETIRTKLEIVSKRLESYYKAEEAILNGAQSYSIGSRRLTRADLSQIQNEIRELEKQKETLENALVTGSKRKTLRVLYRDL